MNEADDSTGKVLEKLTHTLDRFKRDHEQTRSNKSLATGATGIMDTREFFDYFFEVLKQQCQLLILLDNRLSRLERDGDG